MILSSIFNNSCNTNISHITSQDNNSPALMIHRAGHVMVNPYNIVDNGFIAVMNDTIVDVGSRKFYPKEVIDHGSGIIMPSFVNAHTHFELSALSSKIPFDKGFAAWVRELIKEREKCGAALLRKEAATAVQNAILNGTSLIGEISTLGITEDIFHNLDIKGVWFQEYLGNEISPLIEAEQPLLSKQDFLKQKSFSGHAPHTTSPKLLKLLKAQTKKAKLPFSIHVAESDDETQFITTGKGEWADFLKERGIDYSTWSIPSKSPIQYLNNIGLLDSLTLAVHLINIDSQDIEIMAKTKLKSIFCPRSSFNLHKKLPDIPLCLKYGLKPALGTDSLASTDTLNIFDEMLFAADKFPELHPSDIVAMATINGAEALGFDKLYGTLEKGKKADFLYLNHL